MISTKKISNIIFSTQYKQQNIDNYDDKYIPQQQQGNLHKIFDIQDIQLQRSQLSSNFLSFLKIILIIQSLFWCQLLKIKQNDQNVLLKIKNILNSQIFLIYIVACIIIIYIILVFVYFLWKKQYKITDNNTFRINIIQPLAIFIELLQHVSFLLFFFKPFSSVVFVIFTFIFIALYSLYFQNYLIRKDNSYHFSFQINIFGKVILFFWYLCLGISYNINNIMVYTIFNTIFVIGYVLWFYIGGFKLYLKQQSKILNSIIICFAIFIGYFQAINYIQLRNINLSLFFTQFILIMLVTFCSVYLNVKQKSLFVLQNLSNHDYQSLKQIEIKLLLQLEKNTNQDLLGFIHGIVSIHRHSNCIEKQCFTKNEILHDPITNQVRQLKSSSIKGLNQHCLKFYIKCLYRLKINSKYRNNQLLIDYCQFLLNQFQDSTEIMKTLYLINQNQLSFFEQIRTQKIKRLVRNNHNRLNASLYSASLNFQRILFAQSIFCEIMNKSMNYIKRYIQIWKYISSSEIQLAFVLDKISVNEILIKQINRDWLKIQEFVFVNPNWKAANIVFRFFFQQKKAKNKQIDELNEDQDDERIRLNLNSQIHKQQHKQIKKYLFDPKSCCFSAKYEDDSLIFENASKNFEIITGYNVNLIRHCKVDLILQNDLQKIHDNLLKKWLFEVRYWNEFNYNIKQTKLRTKYQIEINVLKYFKILYNHMQNQLKYICFMKSIQKQENNYKTISQIEQIQQQNLLSFNIKKGQISGLANIFYKQEQYQPVQCIFEVQTIIKIIRICTFALILTLIILFYTSGTTRNQLSSYGPQYRQYLFNYKLPFSLGIKYFQYLTNLTPVNSIKNTVLKLTKSFQNSTSNPLILKTIFDHTINLQGSFGPYIQDSKTSNISFDQYQVYFKTQSFVTSLQYLDFNYNDINYRQYRNYMKPSIDNFFNKTRYNYHQKFKELFSVLNFQQALNYILISIIGLITICCIIYYIFNLFQRLKQLSKTIFQFDNSEVIYILNYWQTLQILYNTFKIKWETQNFEQKRQKLNRYNKNQSHKSQKKQKLNLNRKQKRFVMKQEINLPRIKTIFMTVFYLISIIIIILILNYVITLLLTSIQKYQEDGFTLLKYFPQIGVTTYASMQKYFSTIFPEDPIFSPQKFDDHFEALYNYGNQNYIGGHDLSSVFYQKRKQYYFGNLCIQNIDLIINGGFTKQQCQSIFNGSYSRGLGSAIRRQYDIASKYVHGQSLITPDQLRSMILSASISAVPVINLVNIWTDELMTRVDQYSREYTLITYFQIGICLLCHIVIFQIIIKNKIKNNYNTYKTIYNQMVPQYLIQKDKVMRQKFITENIIKKF